MSIHLPTGLAEIYSNLERTKASEGKALLNELRAISGVFEQLENGPGRLPDLDEYKRVQSIVSGSPQSCRCCGRPFD